LGPRGPTPGIWRKLAGPASAGAFHFLAVPARVYDSRNDPAKKIPVNTARTISLKSTTALPAVPAGASGAQLTLTVTNTEGSGFITVYSNALATNPNASNANWFGAGQTLATLTATAVDSDAKVKVYSGANITDVIIDVIGYYI
jgi:hypothetical protein